MSALRTLAFLALVAVSSSQTSDCSYVGLLTHLNLTTTNDLLATMRPVKVWTTPTLFWTNEFLTWNSTDFCGINMLTIPRTRLWIPDIEIREDTSDVGSIHKSAIVKLYPNGSMLATTRERLTSTCRMDLVLFPFDMQECTITFSSMTSEGSQCSIEARGEKLSFKVTILLSISVMLLILQDILPSTEANMPMIAKYCLFIFTFVGLSVLEAMLVGYLYDLDEPAGAEGIPDKSSLPLDGPVDGDLLKLILQEVKAARQEVEEHKDQRKTGRYRRAAVIIDRVFFFFYFFATVVFVLLMNTLWVSNIYNK
ncbi:hypothetical protein F7725_003000 [Dissostichus mawsoni]|uniref:Neurotransmitter-gated ion-channel ligand-binding domain-containing protein n=1 Tax=Dissostichus mawsoni TaxID=36200 RepID=A0A7J5Y8X7_DISMA|nr:hypothetical protein F7725_003000 [Dissostichus mawsoni]